MFICHCEGKMRMQSFEMHKFGGSLVLKKGARLWRLCPRWLSSSFQKTAIFNANWCIWDYWVLIWEGGLKKQQCLEISALRRACEGVIASMNYKESAISYIWQLQGIVLLLLLRLGSFFGKNQSEKTYHISSHSGRTSTLATLWQKRYFKRGTTWFFSFIFLWNLYPNISSQCWCWWCPLLYSTWTFVSVMPNKN